MEFVPKLARRALLHFGITALVLLQAHPAKSGSLSPYTIIELDGKAWESGGFPPSNAGDALSAVGFVTDVFPPLTWDTSLYEYTWHIWALTSLGQTIVGPEVITAYTGGQFQIYADDFAPIGTAASYGTNPPNATAPSTFTDATADPNFLRGHFTSFKIVYNTVSRRGYWDGDLFFDSGTFVNNVGTATPYSVASNLSFTGQPQGYAFGGAGTVTTPGIAEALTPANPSQIVSREVGTFGRFLRLEKRHAPPALDGQTISFDLQASQICGGGTAQVINLYPRSGTGPVFRVNQMSYTAYFLMDNLAAPGYYDIETVCGGGQRDTLLANVLYVGYQGYQPSGSLINSVNGNPFRGAWVEVWKLGEGTTGYVWVQGSVATSGSFSFDVGPGTYKLHAQYGVGDEFWSDPIVWTEPLSAMALFPGEDFYLAPTSSDSLPPSLEFNGGSGLCVDATSGLSVLEVLAGTLSNLDVTIEPFVHGDDSVAFSVGLIDTSSSGSVTLVCEDLLGNRRQQVLTIAPTGVSGLGPVSNALVVHPNPTAAEDVQLLLRLPTEIEGSLGVFDVTGRRVRIIVEGLLSSGTTVYRWDGLDENGRAAGSGTYFVRFARGQAVDVKTITLIR